VEPDYLLDSEVFYFQPCLYPMKYLHPSMYRGYPLCGVRGGYPLDWGVWGKAGPQRGFKGEAPEGKIAL
jgi:hypothetical protein